MQLLEGCAADPRVLEDGSSVSECVKGSATPTRSEVANPLGVAEELVSEFVTLSSKNEQLEHTVEFLLQQVRRLQTLAYADSLTGLGNRRHFDMRLAFELRRAMQSSGPLTLLICDVDRFKLCNDTYGHPAGDALLSSVANLLKEYCRNAGDLAVRYGGDEFALLWPVAQETGRHLTDELRTRVRGLRVPRPGPGADRVTLSLSVTTFSGLGSCTARRFVGSADDALYRAKRSGRDRAVFAFCGGVTGLRGRGGSS